LKEISDKLKKGSAFFKRKKGEKGRVHIADVTSW